jgi:hypothetical protein
MVKSKRPVKIVKRVNPLLWLLPLLFVAIGGIIAWGFTKSIDKKKADYMLIFGIVWTFVGIGLLFLI